MCFPFSYVSQSKDDMLTLDCCTIELVNIMLFNFSWNPKYFELVLKMIVNSLFCFIYFLIVFSFTLFLLIPNSCTNAFFVLLQRNGPSWTRFCRGLDCRWWKWIGGCMYPSLLPTDRQWVLKLGFKALWPSNKEITFFVRPLWLML